MNTELYQVPTLALLAILMAVFGALWLEGRSRPIRGGPAGEAPTARRRQMLWLLGWVCVVVRLSLQVAGWSQPGWQLTLSVMAMEMAPLMFLGSLAPQYLTRKPPILYVVAFGLPVMVYCAVVGFQPHPGEVGKVTLLACAGVTIAVAARWSMHKYLLPIWLSLLVVAGVGGGVIWMTLRQDYQEVGVLVHSGVLLMTALLFISAFRRVSPGLVFTVGGMVVWSLPSLLEPLFSWPGMPVDLERARNLARVITAMGMVVLVLEEEIALNLASQQRDRRVRLEMEKYTALYLADMPFDEEGGQYNRVCETIADVSRFGQAAIFAHSPDGTFRLAGRAGMSGALEGALESLARRTTVAKTIEIAKGNFFTQVVGNLTLMDLAPLMEPGDELAQMNFRRVHIMGIRTRDGRLQGALVLAGRRFPEEPLVLEDVLPLELLVSRIGAAREHVSLLRRLMQSERLAGLGQLAGGVAHELNNPLQAVTGFAELLVDDAGESSQEHAAVILSEARRMKQIIESLLRFRNPASTGRAPVAVDLLLADIEKLLKYDLESARIDLRMHAPETLPRVRADGEQIRQVFLQVMKNAMTSLGEEPEGAERRLTVEAAAIPKAVEITIADTGPGFAEPARAFDPFFTTRHPGEGVGLGLSICYAIVQEHGGAIAAVNLHPKGAAVVIELPLWEDESASAPESAATAGPAPNGHGA
ncbi:MAG TPA: ATP-binding protein [Acidobacteriaceae bacterium]|jgi:signal transduction histidine kinase|nr:ATP-binding protein [Acidobacteriaceae bacterium]